MDAYSKLRAKVDKIDRDDKDNNMRNAFKTATANDDNIYNKNDNIKDAFKIAINGGRYARNDKNYDTLHNDAYNNIQRKAYTDERALSNVEVRILHLREGDPIYIGARTDEPSFVTRDVDIPYDHRELVDGSLEDIVRDTRAVIGYETSEGFDTEYQIYPDREYAVVQPIDGPVRIFEISELELIKETDYRDTRDASSGNTGGATLRLMAKARESDDVYNSSRTPDHDYEPDF